ncbi:copper homeostasis protein CutC [Escherichia coli]
MRTVRELGFPGLVTVFSMLTGMSICHEWEKIMAVACSLAVTFHRAFDMCANP